MSSVALRPQPTSIPAGTEEAARLFEEYSEQIFGYCLRHLGSRSEAEDAVQTTFLYALRALRRGVIPECESAWLTAIAKNVCLWQRRTLDRRGPLASDIDLDRIGLAQPDGDEDEILAGLKDALASLPERQRRALLLREWQGLSSREIATKLEMTPTATYALLTRARRSLAQALTASQRPVLGLNVGTLLYQLRFKLKALLGGVGAKAATTAVVAGVVIGGVTVERALNDERAAPRAPAPAVPGAGVDAAMPGVALAEEPGVSKAARAQRRDAIPMARPQTPQHSERAIVPAGWLPGADAVPDSAGDPAAPSPSEPGPAPPLPVDPPPVLDVELLTNLLPPDVLPTNLLPPDVLPPIPPVPPLPSGDLPSPPPTPDLGLPPLS